MVREVAESCLDVVMIEMVMLYSNRLYASKPDLAARRIEAIGYQVGHQLSERRGGIRTQLVVLSPIRSLVPPRDDIGRVHMRYTMERPRFTDHLEAIKFICKDFWSEVFKKQIDNLKTNHRGTFVLQDNTFRWLSHASLNPSPENTNDSENSAVQATNMHLYFPCGIIRGALTNLGIPCAVSADISNHPACSFVVRIKA